jgi:hypothetical protein
VTYVGTNLCLSCGVDVDAATDPFGENRPSPGDATVCLYCGHIMIFGEGLKLRNLNDAEHKEFAGDKRILMIQRARGMVSGGPKAR